MSSEVAIDPGICLGFGGTNARIASCADGDILDFSSVQTPAQPEHFFKWMARSLLDASDEASAWLVAGFPGPVSADGTKVGPLVNVSGLKERQYDLRAQLNAADPAVGRLLDQGFTLLAVNDGTLAAQAAAARVGEHRYAKTGALIFGTGVGAGVVEKDPRYANVHRVDQNPLEIGHLLVGNDSFETFEQRYSGTAIQNRFEVAPQHIDATHPVWAEEGGAIGRLAVTLGIMSGIELVVPTGGVGAGASDKYKSHLRDFIADYRASGNATQRNFTPEILFIPPEEAAQFEMYGAEGVIRDYLTPR